MPTLLVAVNKRRLVAAEVMGFCYGVRRAVALAEAARRDHVGEVTTLGPIVHNEQVTSRLSDAGIGMAPTIDAVRNGTIVLSAHGVAPSIPITARSRGLNVVDVTCPFVTRVHRAARRLHEQGYAILLVGDEGHTEVIGIAAAIKALGGDVTIVSSAADVLRLPQHERLGVICQTTQRRDTFEAVVAAAHQRAPVVHAVNTICGATDELQEAAVRLARRVDVVLVVGGRKSANSRRLCELCEREGTPAYRIETADEIDERWFDGAEVIGLTAGASTPDEVIEEVARRVNGGCSPDGWDPRHPDE